MSITFEQPLEYPAALIKERSRLPKFLYIVVDDIAFPSVGGRDGVLTTSRTGSYFAKREFTWNDMTKSHIEKHLKYKSWEVEVSSFVSAYESEATALKFPPFSASPTRRDHTHHAAKLILDTHGLVPAWATTTAGPQIPIWIEQGALPKVPKGVLRMTPEGFNAFEASAWMCLDEVRVVLGLKEGAGEKGEWLACGYIPRGRVCGQVVLHGVKTKERRLVDEEVEEVAKIRKVKGKERQEEPMQHIGHPPQIPVRTSSLRSFCSDDGSEGTRGSLQEGRLTPRRPRDSKDDRTIKFAQSLLKKALILSAQEVETERLLQEVNDMRIHTAPEIADGRLNHQASVAVRSSPEAPQAAPYANDDKLDEQISDQESLAEHAPYRAKEQERVAVQERESTPGSSGRTRSQDPQPSIESMREDLDRPIMISNPASSPQPPLLPPRNPDRRRVAFALPDGSPSRRQHHHHHHHRETLQTPTRTNLPHNAPPTPPPDSPSASLSPRTLAWFDRIERNQDRGIELRARIAQMQERNDERRDFRDAGIDCSTWYIPEEICSEEVLNERLDLPLPTPEEDGESQEEEEAGEWWK